MQMVKYPRKIAIGFQEGTCPLNCKKCFAFGAEAKRKKEVKKMSMERIVDLINEIAQITPRPSIQPHIYTEPFANNDLKDIILLCVEKNIDMSIITNGILVNDEWIDFMVKKLNRNYTISFSLDAVSQKVYEKVRGNYQLNMLEDVIIRLLEERGENGPRIGVNFVVEEDNYHEAEHFLNKWKYVADAVRIGVGIDFQKKIPERFRKAEVQTRYACRKIDEVMVIDTDGDVRVCQFDAFGETNLGNVFDDGVLNVWNGEKITELRKVQESGSLEKHNFCYGCEGGLIADLSKRETDEFYISEASYLTYYNHK